MTVMRRRRFELLGVGLEADRPGTVLVSSMAAFGFLVVFS